MFPVRNVEHIPINSLIDCSMSFFLCIVPAVVVGVDEEEVDLAAGSQHIIPYQLIADLIQKNQVQLI